MRESTPPIYYLVGTPKGRLSRYEKELIDKPWHTVREGVEVKLLPQDDELYGWHRVVIASTRSAPCGVGN